MKLEEIASFSKGKGISKNEITEEGNPCIRYGELYTKYNELIDEVISKTNIDNKNLIFSEFNDILIPCSGETAIDLATASCVLKENVAIGGDITIIKTNQYAPFITYYINYKKNEIAKYAQGVSIVHLYPKDFKNLYLNIPSIKEQKKIIDFISTIDKKIILMQKKHKSTEKIMKHFLINFTEENFKLQSNKSSWDYLTLNKVSDVRDGTHDSPKYFSEGYPLVTSKNLLDNGKLDLNNVNFISKEDYDKINKRSKVEKGDILFGMIGTIGNPVIVESDDFAIKNVALIKEKKLLKNRFLNYVLKSNIVKKQFYKLNAGGTQKFIALNLIRNLEVPVPPINEQYEIVKIMDTIDYKVNLYHDYIESLKIYKKGLLQKMFV